MSADQAPPAQIAPGPQWEIPKITGVEILRTPFEPPKMRHFENPMPVVSDALAIVVSLESPLPIRAMSPILWIGEQRLTESESVDKEGRHIRFWASEPSKLRDGAEISLSWDFDLMPNRRRNRDSKSAFTFQMPAK